ncbi:ATP-binding cassette, subfamily B, MsbA [Pontibacter ummariensis]|uniref:ATP-binding cassette, subfamily B, MsbA n=1 Tax=Pontibacter ummariensis TaxID=1610492 RepID=A0A239EJW7_9BACT|nr:ABC transporter ATP-binding protein [Pontibacter ummariensis]PRY13299.1 ATP-binding cassette, subfamily B, MsbA [Pontibacter ummariensis]SNS44917.1 ATP-binding cassette, subfamily B, MsbA [Pontibacter ummariensis]
MGKIKDIFNKYFGNFAYFYHFLGNKIFISVGLSILVGVLDGFGLAMFLPLLQMIDSRAGEVDTEQMGNLSFLVEGLKTYGVELNLQTVLLIMLSFFTLKGIMKFLEGFYKVVLQQRFIRQIRFSNISLLSGYSYTEFVNSDSGKIQNTFSGEVDRVNQAYQAYFKAYQYGVMVFVYMSFALMANAQFAIFVAIGGILTNALFNVFYKKSKQLSKKFTNRTHSFQGLLIQMVANFKYLKASGLIHEFGQKLKKSIGGIELVQRRLGTLAAALVAIREPLVILVVVVVILVQVNLFGQSLGLIILSLLFFYRALNFLMSVQNYWNTFLSVSGSLYNMTEFSEELERHQERSGTRPFGRFEHEIELKDLDFSYDNTQVLRNVSLRIRKNETVALVGESGSGKTTLMNVLSGLLQVNRGTILIDGVELQAYDVRSFQRRIGYITQEPVIFNDTVFNNITFWDEPTEKNIARFYKALRMASIYDFVMSLPEKEHAPLGNNGIMVSGGQKQRLSIARELYKEVDFLFMDEATSALDSETEKSIQENIEQLRGKYTIIIIAHRLSTVRDADRIVYLKNGMVENEGSFDALKETSNRFKRMVEMNNL